MAAGERGKGDQPSSVAGQCAWNGGFFIADKTDTVTRGALFYGLTVSLLQMIGQAHCEGEQV